MERILFSPTPMAAETSTTHKPEIEQLIKNATACLGISPGEDSGRKRIRKQNAEL